MTGIQLNGVWSKVIATLAATGVLAAFGAALRLEVLAAEVQAHEEKATHDDDPTVGEIGELKEHAIRQEAVNEQVKETASDVREINRKVDALLINRGINPSEVVDVP